MQRYNSKQDGKTKGNIDVLMISETQIEYSFLVDNFFIGFSAPYCLDLDSNGGGVMLNVREDPLYNLLSTEEKDHVGFYVELNMRNEKRLINCSYSPNKAMTSSDLDVFSKYLDLNSSTFEKILILDDFNVELQGQKSF